MQLERVVRGGVVAAITTPFEDGDVCVAALARNLAAYLHTALAGFLVAGSTGEAVLLDAAERALLIESARRVIPRDRRLIVGVDAGSTAGALRQAREAGAAGADAVLVSTPHYYRDAMTHEALVAHFSRIADGSPVPILLYNVPKFTQFELPAETVVAMSRHGNVLGIKDSSGSVEALRRLRSRVPPGFRIECGAASALPEALAAGADGAMLALAAVLPEPLADIGRAAVDGPLDRACETHARLMRAAGNLSGHGVAGIKAAMDLRGLYGGPPRPPLLPVAPEVREALAGALGAVQGTFSKLAQWGQEC